MRFGVKDGKGIYLRRIPTLSLDYYPWTIPANLGICLNAHLDYVVIETNIGNLVVKGLLEDLHQRWN